MNSPRVRNNPFFSLESIPETEVSTKEQKVENSQFIGLESIPESEESTREQKGESIIPETKASIVEQKDEKSVEESLEALKKSQQEYFVPWHLPYHRAEVSGASASALASGLAKKDDRKGAVVYNRYYHVFSEGELERLASGVGNAMIVDRFFDKSNWCIVLQKEALNQD